MTEDFDGFLRSKGGAAYGMAGAVFAFFNGCKVIFIDSSHGTVQGDLEGA